jgi:hypothetical protein
LLTNAFVDSSTPPVYGLGVVVPKQLLRTPLGVELGELLGCGLGPSDGVLLGPPVGLNETVGGADPVKVGMSDGSTEGKLVGIRLVGKAVGEPFELSLKRLQEFCPMLHKMVRPIAIPVCMHVRCFEGIDEGSKDGSSLGVELGIDPSPLLESPAAPESFNI